MNGILSVVLLILLFVLGIVYCFWGYKYLKVIILIYALFAGGMFTYNLLSEAAPNLGNWVWIISLAVGLVLGALAFFFIKFSIFVAGGIMGVAVYNLIRGLNPSYFSSLDSVYVFLIGLACFIIFGAITLAARKHLIIIFSSVFGAYSLVYTAGILIGLLFHTDLIAAATPASATSVLVPASIFYTAPLWVMIIPIGVFSIVGMIAQYRCTARNGKKSK